MTTLSEPSGRTHTSGQRPVVPPLPSPELTVIVPAFNEAGTIDELLRQVLQCPHDKQIIVVDDASTDGTTERLSHWSDRGQIQLLRHAQNRGKGAAIRTALPHALGQYVIIQDADLEYDPQDYLPLVSALRDGDADVVYGSRYANGCGFHVGDRFSFRCGVALLNMAVRVLYGIRITDEATCYKLFPRQVLEVFDLECERFEFCPEVTAKACRLGLKIQELPITYRPRTARAGKKLRLRDGFAALYTLWRWRNWQPSHSSQRDEDKLTHRQQTPNDMEPCSRAFDGRGGASRLQVDSAADFSRREFRSWPSVSRDDAWAGISFLEDHRWADFVSADDADLRR